jgi:hypothetical protein
VWWFKEKLKSISCKISDVDHKWDKWGFFVVSSEGNPLEKRECKECGKSQIRKMEWSV